VKWFTRRANEYSHLYGPVMNDLVKSHVNVESCILDGEMVRETSAFLLFTLLRLLLKLCG